MNRRAILGAAIAAIASTGGGVALAQQSDNRQFAVATNPSQSMNTVLPQPQFRVFGIPLGISAPVGPPYANSAYRNFAGQPATGYSTLAQTGGVNE